MILPTAIWLSVVTSPAPPIDRKALVQRHNVYLTKFDGERPLQVGNGNFAFGMDITGLQTFAPFNTMSHWGWHTGNPPAGTKIEDFAGQVWDTHGRPVRYPMFDPQHPEISQWLASSPHRINLGRLGLILTKKDGSTASPSDLQDPSQSLDLWTGIVTSKFKIEGEPVTVTTACHPVVDSIAVTIRSPLMKQHRIAVALSCPGNNPLYLANFVGDWINPGKFDLQPNAPQNSAVLTRQMDEAVYQVGLNWNGDATLHKPQASAIPLKIVKAEYGTDGKWLDVTAKLQAAVADGRLVVRVSNELGPDPAPGLVKRMRVTYTVAGKQQIAEAAENQDLLIESDPNRNRYRLEPTGDTFSFTCTYAPKSLPKHLPTSGQTIEQSKKGWAKFWQSGGAIDLSGSTDPRWKELERRIVLSQYLMGVNEAGAYPPQESGLVNNSWYGRFHMEMVWWHAAQWALWNRWDKVDRSLTIYKSLLPKAEQLAKSQGYNGARWPKAIGPDGGEWPHEIHSLLIWQQPHPIFFAELDYRAHPTKQTLLKWQPVVEATANFMASYAFFDEAKKRYVLGPPLHVVSENVDPKLAVNPAFELGYWRFGLRTAQMWRKRLKQTPNKQWDTVLKSLAPFPTQQGVYVLYEGVPDMWTKFNYEHPALIGTYGMLPGDGVDLTTMRRTLDKVSSTWNFDRTWGWDFPMLAMCAARLGEPEKAVDFLLHPSPGFQFDERGLATGGPFPYFPSNGGLLYAVAMMAAGWDGAPQSNAPGFPQNGKWKVRYEGLAKTP